MTAKKKGLVYYAIVMKDGSIRIMQIFDPVKNPITKEMAKWPLAVRKQCVGAYEIQKDQIPQDRYFREAWSYETGNLLVNMDRAQKIHMDEIRKVRNKKLEELDVETLRGVDVQEKKQKLRDIPSTFDLTKAATPKDLKALWPNELKEV